MKPERSGRDTPEPGRIGATELCRVERWRGYRSSTFVVRAPGGPVYESEPFPWRRAKAPPDDARPRAAYDALVERLQADGWTQRERGGAWCETTFGRPLATPPEPEPEPEPEAQAASAPAARPAPVVEAAPRELRSVPWRPAPAAPPEPLPGTAARRRLQPVTVAAAAALAGGAVGVVVTLLVLAGHPAAAAKPRPVAAPVRGTPVRRTARPAVSRPKATAPQVARADVVITAVRADGSWIEARRGSSGGTVLFRGVLAPGRRLHLRGRTVWARFGAAANLEITANGRPVRLLGTYEKTFHARR